MAKFQLDFLIIEPICTLVILLIYSDTQTRFVCVMSFLRMQRYFYYLLSSFLCACKTWKLMLTLTFSVLRHQVLGFTCKLLIISPWLLWIESHCELNERNLSFLRLLSIRFVRPAIIHVGVRYNMQHFFVKRVNVTRVIRHSCWPCDCDIMASAWSYSVSMRKLEKLGKSPKTAIITNHAIHRCRAGSRP